MKFMRLCLAFCLMLPMLAGCAGNGGAGQDTTLPADLTTAPPQPALTLVDGGVSRYTIVRPEKTGELIIGAATKLHTAIHEITGIDSPLQTDWVKRGQTPDNDAFEILIGTTNRQQSAAAMEGLASGEYVIRVDGNKLVIAGGSDYAVRQGVTAFIDTCLGGGLSGQGYLALSELPDLRVDATAGAAQLLVGVTDQKNSRIAVYDLAKMTLDDSTSLVWSYTIGDGGLGAGIKYRDVEPLGGKVMLYCVSTKAAIVSYPEGKLVWSTSSAAANAHSVELTPDGLFAVASSTGGAVRLFDATTKEYNTYAEAALADAHGVLWDPERNLLWAAGGNILTAYEVGRDPLRLVEKEEYRSTLPSGGAHDLAPVYGDTNRLWITNSREVYQYDKTEKTFVTDYPAADILNRSNIKGIGNFSGEDTWVFTTPDGTYKSWDTSVLHVVRTIDGAPCLTALETKTGAFYKCRIWCSDYQ